MSNQKLQTVVETAEQIRSGKLLLVAGDEALIAQLPAGQWIGGTTANIMAEEGGLTLTGRLFVSDVTPLAVTAKLKTYSAAELPGLARENFDNGITVVIVPGLSDIHGEFAKSAPSYEGVFNTPLYGWIAGVAASEIGKTAPKVFAGNGEALTDRVAALHVELPPGKFATLDIVNLFEPGDGVDIEFTAEGFESTGDCRFDGKPGNLAAYIAANDIDTQLPLVADYNGAMINVSIRAVETETGKTTFYAPVFAGVKYRFARPVGEYVEEFSKRLGGVADIEHVALSCNCILNYLYASLEGKRTLGMVGPITFGEIAYMLLNQTLVYATVKDIPRAA